MADNIDFSRFAGRVAFPRTPSDLLSTSQCPACFTALTTTVCASCGLDLDHAIAAELHDASLATAAALDKRLALIGRIRYDTQQAADAHSTEALASQAQLAEAAAAADTQRAAALAASLQAPFPAACPALCWVPSATTSPQALCRPQAL